MLELWDYTWFFSMLYFPNIIPMNLFPFIITNYNGNYKFRPQFSRDSPELHPGFLMRLPHVTHLSCLSLHTATITSRFPKTAIRITADRNVSSTTFSTDPKPSLELEDTQTQRIEGNSETQERKLVFSSFIFRKVTSLSKLQHTYIVHLIYANVCTCHFTCYPG